MDERYSQSDNSIKVIKRLMKLFKKNRIWLVFLGVSTLLSGFSSILMAKGIQGVSDAALAQNINTLFSYIYYVIAAMVIGVLSSIAITYFSRRYIDACILVLHNKCEEHIVSLDMSCMDESRSGDLLSRMTYDVNEVERFLEYVILYFVTGLIIFIVSIAYMFMINWQLTVLSSICVPAFTILVAKISKKLENQMRQQQESFGSETNVLEDSFMGLPELKAFGLGRMMFKKYCREVDNTTLKAQQMYKTECRIMPLTYICGSLPLIVTMLFGSYLILNNSITFGGLLAYVSLSNNITDPINQMQRAITAVRTSTACIRRVFETWNYPQEREGGGVFPEAEKSSEQVIAFENVTFGYSPDNLLFNGLSFEIKPGEKVALVGSSGCGKSTVLKLITDFYKPVSGKVKIFGRDIEDWSIEALRLKMAEVLQDNYLFPDTIHRNIAYGRPDAAMNDIENAAKSAYIYDFIEDLPEKYETVVGERGVKLSGGQRQRVAIARALLKNAPILLLDEATSALDTESEKEVQTALEQLMAGRTTLIIAHRLSTIRNADRILVMDEGRIVEVGTHDELISRPSVYRQLYNKQFQETDMDFCLSGAN